MIDYRREIDGLRALAVLPVILFHAGFRTFSGGFVGVDVFFVISGYLITSIILTEKKAGTFSVINFYERRARRILPALFVVMAACIPFAWFWLLPNDMKDFAKSLVAVSVFASNILFLRESGYFATAAELIPLLHTWSLAVEEQYYALYPLFLWLMWRFAQRWIVTTLVIMALGSLLFAQWGAYNMPSATFFLLPTRGWELAIGAFLAFYLTNHKAIIINSVVAQIASGAGFVFIGVAVFAFSKETPTPSLYTLLPTIGAALIIAFATPATYVGRLLGTKTFVGIGLISYSAYLWHQPLFAFARHRSLFEPSAVIFVVLSCSALGLGYLSWRFIEQPFRSRSGISRTYVILFAACFSTLFLAVGFYGHSTNGPVNSKNAIQQYSILSEKLRTNHGLSDECNTEFTLSEKCRTSDEPEVLLWGDSFAMHLMPGLLASNPNLKIIQATVISCGPVFNIASISSKLTKSFSKQCIETNDRVYDLLRKQKSIKFVVMGSLFSSYVDEDATILLRDGSVLPGAKVADHYVTETIRSIKELGKIPVIFSPTPQNGFDIGRCLAKATQFGGSYGDCDFDQTATEIKQKRVFEFLKRVSEVSAVVWLHDKLCSGGTCRASFDGTFIYRDWGHMTHEGSAYLGKQMNFYGLIKRFDRESL